MLKTKLTTAVVLGTLLPVSLHSPDAWSRPAQKVAASGAPSSDANEITIKSAAPADTAATPAAVIAPAAAPAPSASNSSAPTLTSNGERKYSFSLKQLGALDPFQLRGVDPIYSVPFSVPSDEVVTSLKMKLDFAYSPALLPNLSHLKVVINGEVAATIPLPKEQAGSNVVKEVALDPRLLTEFNRINLQLIGHYTLECEDPFHSSLWLNISNLSTLEFTSAPLSVQHDLALLPGPFFDRRNNGRLELPFVFGANPSTTTLEAAGIVSSWFGALASYRGAYFPANLNTLPADNMVVFATNDDRPAGVTLPAINGPTLSVGPHPNDARFKVLYVLGRDAKELRSAATALGLGRNTFSGQTVTITAADGLKARQAYDAPNWLPSNRPVKLGELGYPADLNVQGLRPDAVRVNMRLAPDLFGWRSKGVPLDLRYRYTPRPQVDKSTLNVSINRNFVTAFPLLPFPDLSSNETVAKKLQSALSKEALLPSRDEVALPFALLPARSQLQFHYHFDYPKQGACKDIEMQNLQGAIDPDSTVDVSSFPHYMEMPNLAAFANAGFPFTRMADLSETAVVLPDTTGPADIGAYLALMGRMGESTGLAAYNVSVGRAAEAQKFGDKDILLVGNPGNQPLLAQWGKNAPFSANGQARLFSMSEWFFRIMPWFDSPNPDRTPVVKLSQVSLARDSVLVGFESPLKGGRSVVAVVNDKASGMGEIINALMDTELASKIQGSLVVVRGKEVTSMTVGDTYSVGTLPPLTKLRWMLANNSWMMGVLLLVGAVILGAVVYSVLRTRVNRRLKG